MSKAPHRATAVTVVVDERTSVAFSRGAVQVHARNVELDPFDEGSVAPDSERLVDLWGDDERR